MRACKQVNKIREVPQYPHILVTHTDAKELYVWNVLTQPNRATEKARLIILVSVDGDPALTVTCLYTAGGHVMVMSWCLKALGALESRQRPQQATALDWAGE